MLGRRRKEEEGLEGGDRDNLVDNIDSHRLGISKAFCIKDIMADLRLGIYVILLQNST